ncbi:MAG: radical SAM protein [Candidatus Methanoperedens sp.]|nr:radical SAM protein [Candidatus Methanoperedens sp.]MCE8427837.1 radical SAM protein [Candidatus Methanoperedens sp.]
MIFEGFPLIIGWELTLACNLRCNHCGSSAGYPRPSELTTKESLKICDQFPDLLVQEVNFTGGEPLLRSDWEDIAVHLRDLGIATKILTNGMVLQSDIVSRIKDAGISGVGISLDGLEQTHNRIRASMGSFQYVLNGIEMVLRAEIPLTVITTVNALNIHELPALFDLLQSAGVKSWRVQPIIPVGRVQNSVELGLGEQAYIQLEDFVQRWSPTAKKAGMKLLYSDGLGYFEESEIYEELPWRGCSAGILSCGITSDGKIKGCLSLPDELVDGDLRKNDLWDIWFNPDSFAYTRQFSVEKLGYNCSSCDKGEQCRGGCSAKSYGNTNIFHNDPYCVYKFKNGASVYENE